MAGTFRFWRSGPSLYRSSVEQADSARDSGDPASAAMHYQRALEQGAPDGVRKQLANMLKDSGSYNDAFYQYSRCLETQPDDPDAFLQMGHLYKLQGRLSEAATHYARAMKFPATAADAEREISDLLKRQPQNAVASKVDGSPIIENLHNRIEHLTARLDTTGSVHEQGVLLQELRNNFEALVPFFLNTASTIARIGKTLEDLTGRIQALEQVPRSETASSVCT